MSYEILDGIDAIRKFWDPRMSESHFYRHVRPYLDAILFKRSKSFIAKHPNIPRYYTYANLVQILKLRLIDKKNENL